MLRGWNPSNTPGVQRETNGDMESEKDRRRDWEVCEQWMSGFESVCMRACVCLSSSYIRGSLLASVCRFCLSGCTLSKSVCEPGCVLVAAVVGEGVAKTLKKERKPFFFHLCASGTVPASVPSAMGTKKTVTNHSFPWRAVAWGRIGDFSQGYLWHCWSLILRVGPLCCPIPSPHSLPSHIRQHPSIFLAIYLSPRFRLMFSVAIFDLSEYWWVNVYDRGERYAYHLCVHTRLVQPLSPKSRLLFTIIPWNHTES